MAWWPGERVSASPHCQTAIGLDGSMPNLRFVRALGCGALCLMTLLFVSGGNLVAQSADKSQDEQKGFTFYVQFVGSSNTLGQVMKLDASAGYNFNKFIGLDFGIPVYAVRASATSTAPESQSNTGIGDAYVDVRLTVSSPVVNFASMLTGRAPTGDTGTGFSTGRATFDWSNHFDRAFGRIRPFANVGVANTISDTHFFTRPFTSLGLVGHFEGGMSYRFWRFARVGASAYDILPTGQQRIFSKLVRRETSGAGSPGGMSGRRRGGVFENASETVGGADIARDNGYSAWLDASPVSELVLEIGYTRSVHYDLNTVFFGVGINVGSLVRMARGR